MTQITDVLLGSKITVANSLSGLHAMTWFLHDKNGKLYSQSGSGLKLVMVKNRHFI